MITPHILMLDSSEDYLELVQSLLAEHGYQVTAQSKADHSSKTISELAPDLVILDFLWVNDDDGWKLLQQIKLDPRTSSIPLMLCTAEITDAEQLRPRFEHHDITVLYKPFELDDLLTAVRACLTVARQAGQVESTTPEA